MAITSVLNLVPNGQKIKDESIKADLSDSNKRLAWSDPGQTVVASVAPC